MGNSSHIKYHRLTEIREEQHDLFFKLLNDDLTVDKFKSDMMDCYSRMTPEHPYPDLSGFGYYMHLRRGFIKSKEDAIALKYEFNLEHTTLDPFPIGYFKSF